MALRLMGIFVAVGIVCAGVSAFADTAGAVAKSDELWKRRESAASVKAALEALEEAWKADDKSFDLAWRLARTHFWIADQARDKKKKAESGRIGFDYGAKAAEMKPDRVEGWFWGVVALGMYSEGIGILGSIKEGNKGKFEKYLEKALAIDRKYEGAGPLRTKGRSLARLPLIAGRDRKKSKATLKEAIEVAPDRLRTRFYLADVLNDDGDSDEAKKILDEVIAADPKVGDYPDNLAVQGWAKELKKKIEE